MELASIWFLARGQTVLLAHMGKNRGIFHFNKSAPQSSVKRESSMRPRRLADEHVREISTEHKKTTLWLDRHRSQNPLSSAVEWETNVNRGTDS
jgi:hypothetical protein